MRNLPATLYIGAVGATGAVILATSLRNAVHAGLGVGLLAWIAIACLTALMGRLSVRLPLAASCRLSFSDAFVILSLLLFGTDLATLTGAIEGCFATPNKPGTWHKRLFNTGGLAIAVNLSSRLFERMIRPAGTAGFLAVPPGRLLLGMIVLAAALYSINTALVAGVIALTERVPLATVWQASFSWTGTCSLCGAAAAALVLGVSPQIGISSVLAVLPFPVILYFTYRAVAQKIHASIAPTRG
jgi:hypothetical protein